MNPLWTPRPLLRLSNAGIQLPHASLSQICLNLHAGDCMLLLSKDHASALALLRLATGKLQPNGGTVYTQAMRQKAHLLTAHTLPSPQPALKEQLRQPEYNWLVGLLSLESWVYGQVQPDEALRWRIAMGMAVVEQCGILGIALPRTNEVPIIELAHDICTRYGMAVIILGHVRHFSLPYFTHAGILEQGQWAWQGALPKANEGMHHEAIVELCPPSITVAEWVIKQLPARLVQVSGHTCTVRLSSANMLGKLNKALIMHGVEVKACYWSANRLEAALGALLMHEILP